MILNNLPRVVKEILDFYARRHEKTIPIEVFIKKIELGFDVELSDELKEEILNEICSQEDVKIITDKFGKRVISRNFSGDFDE